MWLARHSITGKNIILPGCLKMVVTDFDLRVGSLGVILGCEFDFRGKPEMLCDKSEVVSSRR